MFLLRALESGADGVLLGACHPGDCHYVDGNVKAKRRIDFFMKILDELGLASRVRFEYVSASEGQKFTRVTKEFTEQIRALGPTPIGKNLELTDITTTEERRKKTVFFEMLTNITQAIGYEPKQPLLLLDESAMEGWGYPKRDPETCIGCYTCMNICPEGVIEVSDIENKRVFGALTHHCISCRKCEEACPEEALKVVDGFELMSFLTANPFADLEHDLLACEECGRFYAPVRHVEAMEAKVGKSTASKALDIPEKQLRICPECKRAHIAQDVHKKILVLPTLLKERRKNE